MGKQQRHGGREGDPRGIIQSKLDGIRTESGRNLDGIRPNWTESGRIPYVTKSYSVMYVHTGTGELDWIRSNLNRPFLNHQRALRHAIDRARVSSVAGFCVTRPTLPGDEARRWGRV